MSYINITGEKYVADWIGRQRMPVEAFPTPLPTLNLMCRDDGGGKGVAHGWFVVIGANPGFGKTALALNLAAKVWATGEPVAYVSLEMSMTQLTSRLYAIISGKPIVMFERGPSFDPDQARMMFNGKKHPPIYVPTEVSVAYTDVTSFVRDCYELGCRYFVIDYLQLAHVGDEESIIKAIWQITTDLRSWGVNSGSTIIALSQFNRSAAADYQTRPRMQALWGGMILEASADMVLLLDHSRIDRQGSFGRTYLIVDKNRHGPVRDIAIGWDYKTLKIAEALPDEEHEWPE